jgi:cytochrome c-type protein NapC
MLRILGASLAGAAVLFVSGIIAWGGFNTAMEATNTLGFCISCHEMEANVYQEYTQTVHFQNRTGVRATCSDCHVPDPWIYKIVRKVKATNELYHWFAGTIDTKEKFEANRLTLAKNVWKDMKETDSRECRNCHTWDAMLESSQKLRSWKKHQLGKEAGDTCIDCHKGIAHRPVHKLLTEDDDPYDGRPDARALPILIAAAETPAPGKGPATAAPDAEPAVAPAATADSFDWTAVAGRKVTLFYPGETSMEWVLKGSDHGGARAIKKVGDRCVECHEGEQAAMGQKMVTGEKAETMVIPGKRAAIELEVKASHDADTLYLHFQWAAGEHTPTPFVEGGKMDPDNETKLAIMLIPEENEFATLAGCWATCHSDSRYMPDHPDDATIANAGDLKGRLAITDGVTKYLRESRSEIEIRGTDGKPRGGWDKLLATGDLYVLLKSNLLVDLIRFKSGSGTVENGYILERRITEGGRAVAGSGRLTDSLWTVDLAIPFAAATGDITLDPAKTYTLGVAVHDDYTLARFHHVSLEYRLGFDDAEAEINAVAR